MVLIVSLLLHTFGLLYMLLYFIQYPSRYPSYGVSQRLIVASDNLIKSKPECRKDGEKDMKRNYSIYSQGGVPQVYLKPKREGCNGCTGRSSWNNKWRWTSKVGNHEAGMEAQASFFVINLKKK